VNVKMLLRNTATGGILLKKLAVAGTVWEKTRGLLGRKEMDAGEGLLIPRCRAVHTFLMRFRIGLIFLDEKNVVVAVRKDVKPWRLVFEPDAEAVIECSADSPVLAEIKPGDRLEMAET